MQKYGTTSVVVPGWYIEFQRAVLCQLPRDIDPTTADGWFNNQAALKKVLREVLLSPAAETVSPGFNVWKTINLGTGLKTADDFRKALKGRGFNIGNWANDILGKPAFTAATEATEIDLVKVTVAELGFKKGARHDQIYERAKELGLELCPSEVGPQLRLQYQDQPNGEWLLIGMEPVADSDGDLNVFGVRRHDSGRWLDGHWGGPGHVWDAGYRWLFCLPRK